MKVLEPIKMGNLELKNRYVMVAMGPELGDFTQRTNDYYIRRAKGGASMIMINVLATKEIDGPGPSSTLTQESFEGFKDLVERSHKYDCKVCIQIMPGVGLGTMTWSSKIVTLNRTNYVNLISKGVLPPKALCGLI